MKKLSLSFSLLVMASGMMFASAANAQVNGIAMPDPATAIAASQARANGYQQVATTYQSTLQTIDSLRQELRTLTQQLDTDGNGSLSEAEQQAAQDANNPVAQQIRSKQNEINSLLQPIVRSQIYVLEQILRDYSNSQQQVVNEKNINVILTRDAFVYMPPEADVTQAIVTVINTRLPNVQTAPPTDWRPLPQSQQLYERVNQILQVSEAIQRQRAAQQPQQGAEQPQQQPTGR